MTLLILMKKYLVFSKALDLHMAVAVLRVEGGLDYSKILTETEEPRQNGNIPQVPSIVGMSAAGSCNRTRQNSQESLSIPHNQSFSQLSTGKLPFLFPYFEEEEKNKKKCKTRGTCLYSEMLVKKNIQSPKQWL